MALDGILLHKIIPELAGSLPMRIQKIYQVSTTEVLFQVHTNNGKKQLLISTHSIIVCYLQQEAIRLQKSQAILLCF